MIVVSDTSPLSALFIINRLDILYNLFGKIIIPQTVLDELLELEKRGIDLEIIKTSSWIEVVHTNNQQDVLKLLSELDAGEAEAIVLAKELHADWLLMDETKGRNIAREKGIHIIGLLGVLLQAREKNVINNVKEILDELISTAKFRLSSDLYDRILQLAGEK